MVVVLVASKLPCEIDANPPLQSIVFARFLVTCLLVLLEADDSAEHVSQKQL